MKKVKHKRKWGYLIPIFFVGIYILGGILVVTDSTMQSDSIMFIILFVLSCLEIWLVKKFLNNSVPLKQTNTYFKNIQNQKCSYNEIETVQNQIINENNQHSIFVGEQNAEIKKYQEIPDEVKSLLWIKGVNELEGNNFANEPSLIDMELEVRPDVSSYNQDIGYYPSYCNLSPENRFVYLNWLKNVKEPIPIGYVFIFYYGLERHLLYGKFEEAFNMIVKLRNYHSNNSFYSYSSDALLVGILTHKRYDLIEQIDLNKATPKLVQFVVASLTGGVDDVTLIKNCKEVGFTNKRYINDSYELFKDMLDDILKEKFGITYYPIKEIDFLKCTDTFPIVLANYSLNMGDRIINAPDISTNKKYKKDVFEILSEAHARVKERKKNQRKQLGTTDTKQEKAFSKCNCDGCPKQGECKYGHTIYDEFDGERLTLADKFIMLYAFDSFEPVGDYYDIATTEDRNNRNQLIKMDEEKLVKILEYLQEQKRLYLSFGKCGRAYYNFMKMGRELQLAEECLKFKRRILKDREKV